MIGDAIPRPGSLCHPPLQQQPRAPQGGRRHPIGLITDRRVGRARRRPGGTDSPIPAEVDPNPARESDYVQLVSFSACAAARCYGKLIITLYFTSSLFCFGKRK